MAYYGKGWDEGQEYERNSWLRLLISLDGQYYTMDFLKAARSFGLINDALFNELSSIIFKKK